MARLAPGIRKKVRRPRNSRNDRSTTDKALGFPNHVRGVPIPQILMSFTFGHLVHVCPVVRLSPHAQNGVPACHNGDSEMHAVARGRNSAIFMGKAKRRVFGVNLLSGPVENKHLDGSCNGTLVFVQFLRSYCRRTSRAELDFCIQRKGQPRFRRRPQHPSAFNHHIVPTLCDNVATRIQMARFDHRRYLYHMTSAAALLFGNGVFPAKVVLAPRPF